MNEKGGHPPIWRMPAFFFYPNRELTSRSQRCRATGSQAGGRRSGRPGIPVAGRRARPGRPASGVAVGLRHARIDRRAGAGAVATGRECSAAASRPRHVGGGGPELHIGPSATLGGLHASDSGCLPNCCSDCRCAAVAISARKRCLKTSAEPAVLRSAARPAVLVRYASALARV